jgi:murein DD-endopeptidase MepM/ murein hydrolase activator NlpD
MTRLSRLSYILLFLALTLKTEAQHQYPKNYFRSPLDLKLILSGTFGEIRLNHFHSGIDIRTNGTTGANVYAVADGYVSRIRVSAFGYGYALYITHPNGYVSVYGHLDSFDKNIAAYVKKQHYERESFELDIYPEKDLLPVKKGEVIAKSGSSGSAEGPHLHFELRDETTQYTINPLLFGMAIKDIVRPTITLLKVYPADATGRVNGENSPVKYTITGWGPEHRLANPDTIMVSGNIAFGIQAYDRLSDSDNKNGVYSIELYKDSLLRYAHALEKFSFDETRYVNSLVDFRELRQNNITIQRTKVDPNNKLDIYLYSPDHGVVSFNDNGIHKMKYIVKDASGNTSILSFYVLSQKSSSTSESTSIPSNEKSINFLYDQVNRFQNDEISFEAPENAFYDSFEFHYEKSAPLQKCYTAVYHLQDEFTPIQEYCSLAIKPGKVPERLLSKAFIISLDDSGRAVYAGGRFGDGYINTKIREFGEYSVSVDTVPPVITAVQSSGFKNLAGKTTVRFTIRDDFSGIRDYRATLNGKWLLMEYDAKNDLLIYDIDEHLLKGPNKFRLTVSDNENNTSVYETTLTL